MNIRGFSLYVDLMLTRAKRNPGHYIGQWLVW